MTRIFECSSCASVNFKTCYCISSLAIIGVAKSRLPSLKGTDTLCTLYMLIVEHRFSRYDLQEEKNYQTAEFLKHTLHISVFVHCRHPAAIQLFCRC